MHDKVRVERGEMNERRSQKIPAHHACVQTT